MLDTLFGGTLDAIESVKLQAKKTFAAFTGKHPASVGANDKADLTLGSLDKQDTGYYNMMLLGQFIERYAEAKKLPVNKNWHLAINMPKQNQTFLVTPLQFSLIQNANKPMEYNYSFQLKAFKRILISSFSWGAPITSQLQANKNIFASLIQGLKQCRNLMSSLSNTVTAIRSDFLGIMESLRLVTLVAKDAAGAIRSAADLPGTLIKDLKDTIADMRDDLNMASKSLSGIGKKDKKAAAQGFILAYRASLGDSTAQQSFYTATKSFKEQMDSDPVNVIFNNPHKNFDYFDSLSLDKIKLSTKQKEIVDQETEKAREVSIDNIRDIKTLLLSVATDLSNSFGAGDASYAKTYNKPAPTERAIPMSLEENELITSIFEVIQLLEELTTDQTFDDNKRQNPMQYISQMSADLGLTFNQTTNKKKVPVPFGLTIEEIALRYLNSQDRWLEIATLNNLVFPYIDETGFQLPLLSNGSGRQFTVNDSESKLWIGQTIYLRSNSQPQFTRKITAIDGVEKTNRLITVDGLSDLDSLKMIDSPYLQGYKSGTFNSQNLIWIPTEAPATPDQRSNVIPFLPKDDLNAISGVDWLLTEDGDLAISSSGEFRLANGMTNLIQAIRLKLNTERGRLLRHANYGLGDLVGSSIGDLDLKEVYQMISSTMSSDPRFAGIKNLQVTLDGPTLNIAMEVQIINSELIIPVSFSA